MKKILTVLILVLLAFVCFDTQKSNKVLADTKTFVYVEDFVVNNKVYDSKVIDDINITFVDSDNNKVDLTKNVDYKVEYQKAGYTPKTEKPYTCGEYDIIVSP
ncbi:MAG: hypothetical protein IJW82_03845, partial [Clostridia bacterium]|nr:hypothetical protein [Clostridia bacterium]